MTSVAPANVLGQRPIKKRIIDRVFQLFLLTSLGIGIAALATLIAYLLSQGAGSFGPHLWKRYPSLSPELSGARSALFGTIWVITLTAIIALPIGIGAAIYLEEFAKKDRWYNRAIELNIQNLAAVPSIVYGILGLAFIARGPLALGSVVLTGGLILALLVLPIVIIASREAIRAVPPSITQASLALGATHWQTVRRQVLPAAIPGMATGAILALSRAIGEAAPLIMIGAFTFVRFNPTGLDSQFTVLPIQIFNWVELPQSGFAELAAAASLLLLIVLVGMNSIAIWLRNRYRRNW